VAAPLKGVIGRIETGEAQVKVIDVDLDVIQVRMRAMEDSTLADRPLQAAKKVYQIREDYNKAFHRTTHKHHR